MVTDLARFNSRGSRLPEAIKEHPLSEMTTMVLEFAARLESRHYQGLTMTKEVHVGCDHGSVVAPAFMAGLQAVLA